MIIVSRPARHTSARARPTEPTPRRRFKPGQLLVKVKSQPVAHLRASVGRRTVSTSTLAAIPEAVGKPLEYIENNMGLKTIRPLFTMSPTPQLKRGARATAATAKAAALMSVAHPEVEELSGIMLAEVDEKELTGSRIKQLQRSGAIEVVERAPTRWLAARKKTRMGLDPRLNLQWGLRAMGWFEVTRPDASEIAVAVLDSGIDDKHPDLKAAIDSYETNGFSKRDILRHGTHVSGIIGAVASNRIGIAGVASCALRVWKIFPDEPDEDGEFYSDTDAFLSSLRAAADGGAKIINLSIGGVESSAVEQLVLNHVIGRGVTVVAAMGNEFEDGNPIEYPAAYDDVIAVGGIDQNQSWAEFSNTGQHISVVAPGVAILSTLPMHAAPPHRPETEYDSWDGTSMATPHVAGAAALLLAKQPELTPAQVRSRLKSKAKKLPGMNGSSFTQKFGSGLVYLPKLLK